MEAIDLAKPLILDSLGVVIAGSACSIGQITLALGSETMGDHDTAKANPCNMAKLEIRNIQASPNSADEPFENCAIEK